nr:class II heat shock protein [Tanacetum cinerariifolium]
MWLKGLLTESRYELRLVAGIATGALVKGGSRSEVLTQVEVAAYRQNQHTLEIVPYPDTTPNRVVSVGAFIGITIHRVLFIGVTIHRLLFIGKKILFFELLFMASDGNDQDAEYALSKRLQMGTVEDYQREFEMLIKRLTIPESLLKLFYVFGLTGSTMFTLKGEFASPEVKGSLDADEDIGVDDVSSAIDGVFNIGESNVKSIEARSKFDEFTENKASLEEVVVGGGEVLGVGEDDDLCNATGRGPTTESSESSLTPLTPEELKVDKIVLSWILFTLSDSLHARLVVARPKSTKEAWCLLSAKNGVKRVRYDVSKIRHYIHKSCETVNVSAATKTQF